MGLLNAVRRLRRGAQPDPGGVAQPAYRGQTGAYAPGWNATGWNAPLLTRAAEVRANAGVRLTHHQAAEIEASARIAAARVVTEHQLGRRCPQCLAADDACAMLDWARGVLKPGATETSRR